ncbi:MAG: hypothetical protein MK208_02550 [Shimia sp.]|uniref:arsenic resistance protein n=1 Tax=Shimia sp. TaxID=1954381 RepID=UPI0025D88629|nr:hypothetical protein [Shimia sp.]MCH2066090.1 hypothetical protein [Shimia sp.]
MTAEHIVPQPPDAPNTTEPGLAGGGVAALLLGAMLAGASMGLLSPTTGDTASNWIDPTLLLMISLLLFELRPKSIVQGFGNLRFLGLTWVANFLIIPFIGFGIASLFLSGQPLLFTGLVIYFMSPCTDWFLGFTRMARGDTALGTALIPINMLTQILLFPVWLWLFTRHTGLVDFASITGTLAEWFVVPLIAAQVLRFALDKLLPDASFQFVVRWVGHIVPVVIAALILQIFAANIGVIAAHADAFATILLAIFLFFVATFILGELLSKFAGLDHPKHALLSMTTAARNAPMMLAITAVAIPDQPLILAALVIGMLIEFPHLTALKQILLRQAGQQAVVAS